jgi:fructokinase
VKLIAGIDSGGTTFKCGVFTLKGKTFAKRRIPTSTPEETTAACLSFLESEVFSQGHLLLGLGIAALGYLDLSPISARYGTILNTPKPHWSHFALLEKFQAALRDVPVTIETDVNAALLAEMAFGAAQNVNSAAYITIGTGIGAGLFVNGGLGGRPSHPEFGHIRVKRRPDEPKFDGACPFHGDCLKGLGLSDSASKTIW